MAPERCGFDIKLVIFKLTCACEIAIRWMSQSFKRYAFKKMHLKMVPILSRPQCINWTNANLLSIETLETTFSAISTKTRYKQRVLMHRHQGWNVRHGLCHIYMRYLYIYIYVWVVYSFCLFCCLFIFVTWWYMWCIVWQVASKRKYRHVW